MSRAVALGWPLAAACLPAPTTDAADVVRLEPASADLFYVVAKNGPAVEVTRFQRGVGGSGGSDAGGSWPAFRPTGAGVLPDFEATVAGNVIWLMDEIGACDLVAKNAAGTFMLSYHGLGTGGMVSETITIDGEAVSHTAQARGEAFELRNTTTSISGGTTVSRDLSYVLGTGGILMRPNAGSDTGVALVYYDMPMATGGGYSELHLSYDDVSYTAVDLGTGLADGDLTARSVRMRDPTTGYWVGSRGDLPAVSGFRKLRPDKSTSPLRTKTYMGEFADMASLIGVEVRLEWGVTAPGATTMTNLLDPSWTGGNWAAYTAVNGTVSATDGVLTMTSTSGTTSNLRAHSAIPGVAEGERYVASVDFVSQANTTGTKEFFIGINTNGSTTGAARSVTLASTNVGMRVVTDFVANAVAPNQRFGIRNAGVSPLVTTFQNPIVRKVGT